MGGYVVVKLTERQAMAVLDVAGSVHELDPRPRRGSTLAHFDAAANAIDEARAAQNSPWERCENCNGSGWVEE